MPGSCGQSKLYLCEYDGGNGCNNFRTPNQKGRESCWASGETELGLSMKVDRNPVIDTLSLVHKFCYFKPNSSSFQKSKAIFGCMYWMLTKHLHSP